MNLKYKYAPIEYKLVWDYKEHYNLKYRVKNASFFERLFHRECRWHTLYVYHAPYFAGDHYNDGFNWTSQWITVRNAEEGARALKEYYTYYPTFGDFYRKVVQPEYKKEEKAKQNYKAYWKKVNETPNEIK